MGRPRRAARHVPRADLPRCAISAISQWRTRVAYGLSCSGSLANRKLTGLYVRQGSRRPVRLRRPHDAVRFAIREIESVDLRGTRVAAVAGDIYDYSFSETTLGRGMQSFLAAASEGESDASARGLALQDASTHWTLTLAQHSGDPNASVIFRMRRGCLRAQRLERPRPTPGLRGDRPRGRRRRALPRAAGHRHRQPRLRARPRPALRVAHSRGPRLCSDAASRRPSPCAGRSVAVTWRQ